MGNIGVVGASHDSPLLKDAPYVKDFPIRGVDVRASANGLYYESWREVIRRTTFYGIAHG
jgi:hypothetical protein